MEIIKVAIQAHPSLQGELFKRLNNLPLVAPVIARNIVSKDFQENAMHNELEGFEKKAKESLGKRYDALLFRRENRKDKDPLNVLKSWKKTLQIEEKFLEKTASKEAKQGGFTHKNQPETDYERASRIVKGTFKKGTDGEVKKRIDEYCTVIRYFNGRTDTAQTKTMQEKIRELLVLADQCMLGGASGTGTWESRVDSTLARLFSKGDVHLFVSVNEGKHMAYEKITVSTNLNGTLNGACKIENEDIRAMLLDSVTASGYEPTIEFSQKLEKYGNMPYLQAKMDGCNGFAYTALSGIVDVVEHFSNGQAPPDKP